MIWVEFDRSGVEWPEMMPVAGACRIIPLLEMARASARMYEFFPRSLFLLRLRVNVLYRFANNALCAVSRAVDIRTTPEQGIREPASKKKPRITS